jgi:V8-like Glu-specific endopeptidase
VLTAFKAEGFRYLGRIRLARELDLVSRGAGTSGSSALLAALTGGGVSLQAGNSTDSGLGWWIPPPKDSEGNWIVDAVRCTVEGDMYAGKMLVDGNNPLKVVEAVRPRAGSSGGAAAGGSPALPQQQGGAKGALGLGPAATKRAADEAARLKVAAGSGAAAAVEEAAEALELAAQQVQEQQRKQQQQQVTMGGKSKKALVAAAPATPPAALAGLARALEDGKGAATGWWASLKTAFAQGVAKGRATAAAAKQQQQPSAAAAADDQAADADAPTAAPAAGRSLLSHTPEDQEPSEVLLARRAAELEQQRRASASRPGGRRASAGGGRSLSGIVGADERFACTPRKWPFTAIGQIEVLDDSGVYICTGTLIAPDKVITAGHCVWNSKRGAFYFNLSFSPGRYRTEDGRKVDPWGTVPWSSVTVFDQFKKDPTQWDVAVVTLAQPVGEQAGTMGLAAGCAKNARLWVSGYPQEKAEGTCMTATCLDPVLDCNAQLNAHTCDTTSGMSGAPMFDSKYRVRMLHVAGVEGKQENRATTVSDFLISTVMKW